VAIPGGVFNARRRSLVFTSRYRSLIFYGTGLPGGIPFVDDLPTIPQASGVQDVSLGSTCVDVTHNLSNASLGINAMPNWDTNIWISTQTANVVTICFSNPSPASAKVFWEVFT
jgi:hypothetical protein